MRGPVFRSQHAADGTFENHSKAPGPLLARFLVYGKECDTTRWNDLMLTPTQTRPTSQRTPHPPPAATDVITSPLKAWSSGQPAPSFMQRMAMKLILRFFTKLQTGHLELRLPDGAVHRFGNPSATLRGTMNINDWSFFTKVARSGDIGFGESYTDGDWDTPDLVAIMNVLVADMESLNDRKLLSTKLARLANRVRHVLRANTRSGSEKNIHFHYDLGNEFYRLFLDESMTYSCALFSSDEETLAEGQLNKIRALLNKVGARPGEHILEIGSGWGTLALVAAKEYGCKVTTLTLSREQLKVVEQRVADEGLDGIITPLYCDYRDAKGQYDRIVSVEMLEAVGHEFLGTFFATCDRLLKPHGTVAMQVITVTDWRYEDYRRSTDWIQKYIFPGAVVPSVTAIMDAMTLDSRFMVEHIENIGIHYARTLREWRHAFHARNNDVKKLGFDERFCRIWDYYLCYCESGFASRILGVHHFVLTRQMNSSLPKFGITTR